MYLEGLNDICPKLYHVRNCVKQLSKAMTLLSLKQPSRRATTNLEVFCEDTWETKLAMQNTGMQNTMFLASYRT